MWDDTPFAAAFLFALFLARAWNEYAAG